jgi:hypothetical protein
VKTPLAIALVLAAAAVPARAEDAPKPPAAPAPAPAPAAKAPVVSTPHFENKNCPIMAKPSSTVMFVETPENGRIYVCCLPCVPKIKQDFPRAYAAAYPTVKKLENTVDPWSGETLGKDAVTISLQGHEIRVAPGNVAKARANAQIVLVKATRPKVVDLKNATSPVSGKPVVDDAYVLVDDDLIRLAAASEVAEVRKDPEKARAKAKEIAKAAATPGAPR